MGGKIPLHLCFRNESNLRPLVAKESHSSGLGKGELIQCFGVAVPTSGPERIYIPGSPKEVCKNMGSSSQAQPGEDRDQANRGSS